MEYIDCLLTKQCNLNCYGCCRYAPLCDKNDIYDLNQFEEDIFNLNKNKISVKLWVLTGGEPLLNKDFFKYADIVKKYYPESELAFFSNGKILQNISDETLQKLKNYNFSIKMTFYNKSNIDYKKVVERLNTYNIKIIDFTKEMTNRDEAIENVWYSFKISETHKNDNVFQFKNCKYFFRCMLMFNGKLHLCNLSAYLDNINKFFGTHLTQSPKDYILIKDFKSEKMLKRYETCPRSICGYCNNQDFHYQEWKKSSRTKEEFFKE